VVAQLSEVLRSPRLIAVAGVAVWLASLVLLPGLGETSGTIARLLALAVLVLVPLALALAATPDRDGRHPWVYRAAVRAQPFAALFAVLAFFLPAGALAALLALPWLACTGLAALFGLARLLPRGLVRADEACFDAALLYLPVGAVWLLFARAGLRPLGFADVIVLLTAVHFHFTGFALLIVAGCTGRFLAAQHAPAYAWFRPVAAALILGTPLIAIGITFSLALEVAAVVLLAVGAWGLALLTLFAIVPHVNQRAPRAALAVSALAILAGMAFAAAYAVSRLAGAPLLTIPTMALVHGLTNALGFALPALLAWSALQPLSQWPAPGIPFSRLHSAGRVGPTFYARSGAIPAGAAPPAGIVDDLQAYARADFDPAALHPAVRAFYEHTADFDLRVFPHWRRVFRPGARLVKAVNARLGQMNLPLDAERREDVMLSRLVALDAARDGRPDARGWIRTYAQTGAPAYVAAYANHALGGQTYMNIAFPTPGGNVTSVLRIEALPAAGGHGVLLTTLPAAGARGVRIPEGGDEGVYFANALLPLRLPLDESIYVWPAQNGVTRFPDTVVVARHDMWLLGARFLTLEYEIYPRVTG
jgi:hypothetical protein